MVLCKQKNAGQAPAIRNLQSKSFSRLSSPSQLPSKSAPLGCFHRMSGYNSLPEVGFSSAVLSQISFCTKFLGKGQERYCTSVCVNGKGWTSVGVSEPTAPISPLPEFTCSFITLALIFKIYILFLYSQHSKVWGNRAVIVL